MQISNPLWGKSGVFNKVESSIFYGPAALPLSNSGKTPAYVCKKTHVIILKTIIYNNICTV